MNTEVRSEGNALPRCPWRTSHVSHLSHGRFPGAIQFAVRQCEKLAWRPAAFSPSNLGYPTARSEKLFRGSPSPWRRGARGNHDEYASLPQRSDGRDEGETESPRSARAACKRRSRRSGGVREAEAIVFDYGALETAKQASAGPQGFAPQTTKPPRHFTAVRYDNRFINRDDRNRRIP